MGSYSGRICMSFIRFETIWEDDGCYGLEISASNGKYAAMQEDICIQPKDINAFGNTLKVFPQKIEDQIIFDKPGKYKIKIFCDKTGHPVIEISFKNDTEVPNCADSHFYIQCEASALNKLGYALCDWIDNMKEPLYVELS
jgi:hypothetical protein